LLGIVAWSFAPVPAVEEMINDVFGR